MTYKKAAQTLLRIADNCRLYENSKLTEEAETALFMGARALETVDKLELIKEGQMAKLP